MALVLEGSRVNASPTQVATSRNTQYLQQKLEKGDVTR